LNQFLAAALEYREAGLHPIALLPRSKRPLVPWKEFQDRMPTVEELQGWWAVCADANVGIILGRGAFAVDVDGPEAVAALAAAGIDLGNGPKSITSRGFHMFYGGAAPDKIGLLTHVDVRGVGYVVAPPSVHESGHVYAWQRAITGALPAPPAALVALLAEPKPRAAATQEKWLSLALEGVGEGTRDVTCYKLASYFVSKGIPQDVIEALLFLWADRCEPPFPHSGVVIKVASASKHTTEVEGPPVGLAEIVDLTVAEILAPPEQRRAAAATEFASLDDLLAGGLYPGDYMLIGARPSVGKTALALQILRQLARAGIGGLMVSLEMTNRALVRRLLSQASRIDAKKLKTGNLKGLEKEMLALAVSELKKLSIWLTTDIQTTEQLSTALDAYQPGQLGIVVVDYIQLLSGEFDRFGARERVGAISKALRRLAIRHDVPVLGLSQLRRPERGRPGAPVREDLKESGDLEADADIILLMSREQGARETTLDLAKNRDGEVSGERKIMLQFQPDILTFTEAK
jgi:archaellum biogenesis ATPase FlaH